MLPKLVSFPALLVIAVVPLLAQADDPPARVARINYLSGPVSFRPGGVEEWTAATLNFPLTTGDYLWGDAASRTEIHVGSTAIRMGERTAISVLNLDDRAVQLSLTDGSLHIRLRDLEDDETFEVDTPNVAITLLRAGEYRIDADGENSTTSVTVRSGNAQVTGGGTAFTVRPRQTGRAMGIDTVTEDVGPALPPGEFDYWSEARDRREDEAQVSAQYVPREMVGYEDLDANGVWSDIPEYGPVWRPRTVDVDWAPYRFGRWAWVEPWGWTWIDDAPWGFAPFHYGRWVMTGGGWVWVPGRMDIRVRPVYAPALVVFVGTPGFGGAAWFPLGPREVYRPAYHVSDFYVRRVNRGHVTNVTVINTVYINQRAHGAITAVSHDTFVGARHVGRATVSVDERSFGRATVFGSAAPIAPQRVSVLGRSGPAMAAPPARIVERQVIARRAPPPPPAPFEARRQAIEANQGRPLDRGQMERFRGGAARNPQVRVAPPVNMTQPRTPDRPVVIPRDERPPMRRPMPPTEQPQQQAPRQERPVFRQPEQPRVEPQPAPRQERPVFRPQPEQPRVEAPPRQDRPRVERPQRVDPPPAPAPRVERPAPEQRREARPNQENRGERKAVPRGEPRTEKKDDK